MKHKLGICIPYRNREEHLEKLVPHLSKHLTNQGIEHNFYVAHQIDDKLFNRGAMKNIAAKHAFEDGCDYIAWHDVDMLPQDDVDYFYPSETPVHIATKLSKYDYSMNYDQYFGGVVLFTKEQVERTNGYSNDYWDWGQEDDDLFWRCYYENYTSENVFKEYKNKPYTYFNGINSHVELPTNREISSCLHGDHTISILFSAEQQPEKTPIWLIGDTERKFIEYPILRKDGSWNWGISFNNSRAVTTLQLTKENRGHYVWAKRFENSWTWVTVSFLNENGGELSFYVNDEFVINHQGVKMNNPLIINDRLKIHDAIRPFLLGFCNHSNTRFKGKIAEVKIYDKHFDNIYDVFDVKNDKDMILHYLPNQNENHYNTEILNENIKVVDDILPFRREGTFDCQPHVDEGLVNGKWVKGETTARNEKRFVTEMQQGKINYKNDGINSVNYELVGVNIKENVKIIDVKL